MNECVRNWIFNHPGVLSPVTHIINFVNPLNTTKGRRHNTINAKAVFRKSCKIIIEGTGNIISIDDFSRLIKTKIYIHGDNNHIQIGQRCYLYEADFYIEDSNNTIIIGNHTSVDGVTHFAAIEGTRISVGEDCMFSQNIYVRTGDAHSIMDLNGVRINPSRDVTIGDHCWIGMNAIVMKGTAIGNNSIVGAGAIVSGEFSQGHSVIAGVPAKVIKEKIDWCRKRIDVFDENLHVGEIKD